MSVWSVLAKIFSYCLDKILPYYSRDVERKDRLKQTDYWKKKRREDSEFLGKRE